MAYKKFKTVGELIDILSEFPRDTKIVQYNTNMEQRGYTNNLIIDTELGKFKTEKQTAFDSFDYISYEYDCITRSTKDEYDFEALEL